MTGGYVKSFGSVSVSRFLTIGMAPMAFEFKPRLSVACSVANVTYAAVL
jgi:hypothetical protein